MGLGRKRVPAVKEIKMDERWAKPCLDSDAVFNGVWESVTLRARKRRSRVIPLGWDELITATSRERGFSWGEVADALQSLRDLGWLEKVDLGFQVLFEKNSSELSATPGEAGRERGSLVAKRLGAEDAISPALPVEASAASRATHRSVENYVGIYTPRPSGARVELCRDFFTQLMETHQMETIPGHLYWPALCNQVKKLEKDYNLDLAFIRRMMEEFARHPQWTQRSPRPAWRVFISRRQELVKLVHLERQRDPANRRFSTSGGKEFWVGTSRNRPTQGAESWLRYS